MIDHFLHANLTSHLKNAINLAYPENGTYDRIVAHLEKELEHSGIENDGKVFIPTMTVALERGNENKTDFSQTSNVYCKNGAT